MSCLIYTVLNLFKKNQICWYFTFAVSYIGIYTPYPPMQNVFKFQQQKCGEMYLHLKSIATFTTNNFKNQLIVTVFLPTVTSVFKKKNYTSKLISVAVITRSRKLGIFENSWVPFQKNLNYTFKLFDIEDQACLLL